MQDEDVITGTISESAGDDWSSQRTVNSTVVDGAWQDSGSGSGEDHSRSQWSHTGSGGYRYVTTGGLVTGTINENGGSSGSADTTWSEAMASDGTWQLNGGGQYGESHANENRGYSGNGGYAYDVSGGSVTGTINENGNRGWSSNSKWSAAVNADGQWQLDWGQGNAESHSSDHWSYTGGGNYAYPTTGGSVSGSITESGSDNSSSKYTVDSNVVDGAWEDSGSGHGEMDHATNWSYNGGGSYSYPTAGGTMTGSITVNGRDNESASGWDNDSLNSNGQWQTDAASLDGKWDVADYRHYDGKGNYSYDAGGTSPVSGTATEGGTHSYSSSGTWSKALDGYGNWQLDAGNSTTRLQDESHSAYSGNGPYSQYIHGGTMSGTVNESGNQSVATDYTITSEAMYGQWNDTGDGFGQAAGDSKSSYSGNGNYAIAGPFGSTINGSMGQSGASESSYGYTWDESLGTDGQWSLSSASGGSNENSSDTFGYSGSGAYSHYVGGGTVAGMANDLGNHNSSYTFSTSASAQNGQWIETGGGTRQHAGSDSQWYSGDGKYSRPVDANLTVLGTISESASQNDSYQFNTSGALNADGSLDVSGSGYSEQSSGDNFCYGGTGNYSATESTSTGDSTLGTTFDQTTHETFTESGGYGGSANTHVDWTRDNNGWRASGLSASDSGTSDGSYGYAYDQSTQTSSWSGNDYNGERQTTSDYVFELDQRGVRLRFLAEFQRER